MSGSFSDRVLRRCVVVFGCLAALLFGAAMAVFPGGTYNPAMRMLSALGRTVVAGEKWPLCHHLFVLGMVVSVIAGWAVEKCRGCRWRWGLGRGEV
jgi:MFS family permease